MAQCISQLLSLMKEERKRKEETRERRRRRRRKEEAEHSPPAICGRHRHVLGSPFSVLAAGQFSVLHSQFSILDVSRLAGRWKGMGKVEGTAEDSNHHSIDSTTLRFHTVYTSTKNSSVTTQKAIVIHPKSINYIKHTACPYH